MDNYPIKQEDPIHMNYSAAKAHVPHGEQTTAQYKNVSGQNITDCLTLIYHAFLVKYLVTDAARKLNFFPNKHGVSKYFSPWMILHQENIDYDLHSKNAFGVYIQAHDDNYQ